MAEHIFERHTKVEGPGMPVDAVGHRVGVDDEDHDWDRGIYGSWRSWNDHPEDAEAAGYAHAKDCPSCQAES
jgi:hypothetical protein